MFKLPNRNSYVPSSLIYSLMIMKSLGRKTKFYLSVAFKCLQCLFLFWRPVNKFPELSPHIAAQTCHIRVFYNMLLRVHYLDDLWRVNPLMRHTSMECCGGRPPSWPWLPRALVVMSILYNQRVINQKGAPPCRAVPSDGNKKRHTSCSSRSHSLEVSV